MFYQRLNQKTDNATLWHWRLGHQRFQSLVKQSQAVLGMTVTRVNSSGVCGGCCEGKQSLTPLPKETKTHRHNNASKISKLHLDTVGPIDVQSVDGKKGFTLATCEMSKYTWAILLSNRAELPHLLIELITRLENQLDSRVKVLHSDNGTEFNNKTIQSFVRSKGIVME